MIKEYSEYATSARFVMHSDNELFSGKGLGNPGPNPVNTFIYNKGEAQEVRIDSIAYTMPHRVFCRSCPISILPFNILKR